MDVGRMRLAGCFDNGGVCQFEYLLNDFEEYLNETMFHTEFFASYAPLGLGLF